MIGLLRWIATTLAIASFGNAWAHKASDSYLSLSLEAEQVSGQWDIALRDLEDALGIDANGNAEISWGELRAKKAEIDAYALERLSIKADGKPCALDAGEHLVDDHSDGAYAVLRFTARCAPHSVLSVDYRLLFDIDPTHRGLLRIPRGSGAITAVLGPESGSRDFTLATPSLLMQFLDYLREGVWHIWVGYDHVLFLVSLLLPAVLVRGQGRWQPIAAFPPAFVEVLKIVTSFTLAHSITLCLAALSVVELPSRLVESVIALSVVLAALNNLRPVVLRRRWLVAFGFGLVHGFGFASVLSDLGLPQEALLLALIGFNLGVEAGQLAIVGVVLPLAYLMRSTRAYRQFIFSGGSAVVVVFASIWLLERTFDL